MAIDVTVDVRQDGFDVEPAKVDGVNGDGVGSKGHGEGSRERDEEVGVLF